MRPFIADHVARPSSEAEAWVGAGVKLALARAAHARSDVVRVVRAISAAMLVVAVSSLGAAAVEPTSRSSRAPAAAPDAQSTDDKPTGARAPASKPAAKAVAADRGDTGAPRAKPPEPKAPAPRDAKAPESKSSDAKSSDSKSGDAKSDAKSGDGKSGDAKSGAAKSGESKATESKSEAAPESPEAAQSCLAQALYWEAGIEGREGMIAVAWVVLNRSRSKEFPPGTICGVVKQGRDKPGCQFSYWCDGKSDTPKQDANWALAQQVAREMLTSPPPDPTGGALFYHAVDVRAPWAPERERTAQIGRHVYYR